MSPPHKIGSEIHLRTEGRPGEHTSGSRARGGSTRDHFRTLSPLQDTFRVRVVHTLARSPPHKTGTEIHLRTEGRPGEHASGSRARGGSTRDHFRTLSPLQDTFRVRVVHTLARSPPHKTGTEIHLRTEGRPGEHASGSRARGGSTHDHFRTLSPLQDTFRVSRTLTVVSLDFFTITSFCVPVTRDEHRG